MAMTLCTECNAEVSTKARVCPKCGTPRSVGPLLWFGIFVFPFLFSWFTLKKKYSRRTRVVAFLWLVANIGISAALMHYEQTPEYQAAKARLEAAESR